MKKEVKKKWVAALRSGKYKQGKGALRSTNNEFCCLGVLCDVARKEGVIPNPRHEKDDDYAYGRGAERRTGLMPASVAAWAGLGEVNPIIGDHAASHWNDSVGKSFDEIADLIEEYL